MARRIDRIIIHCTDTVKGRICTVEEITRWHKARGMRFCGYHIVVQPDGSVQFGRPIEDIGAHAKGYNSTSIGICYAGGKGGDTRTYEQTHVLRGLVAGLKAIYPNAEVLGHRDLPGVTKLCPSFDVKTEL